MTLAQFRLSSQSFIIFLQACAAIVFVEEFHTFPLAISQQVPQFWIVTKRIINNHWIISRHSFNLKHSLRNKTSTYFMQIFAKKEICS